MAYDEEALFDQLNDWLTTLTREVQGLTVNRHIFWEVQKIISNNKNLHIGSTFYEWMGAAYATSMSVALRRQVDEDDRSISFINLLKRIRSHPQVLSRSRYTSLFRGVECPRNWPDKCFDGLVGEGHAHLQGDTVAGEISALKVQMRQIAKYVNKRVAHRDAQDFRPLPKFADIDAAVKHLDRLTVRYINLFRGISMNTTLPTWQYDWKEIFRHTWLVGPDGSSVRSAPKGKLGP